MYAQIKDDTFEIISCTEKYAQENNLILIDDNFTYNKYQPKKVSSYHNDFSCKTEDEMIAENLIIDNRGVYYDKTTCQEIKIKECEIEIDESLTKLKPQNEFSVWDNDKWVVDIEKARQQKLSELNTEYQTEFTKGFQSNGGQFGCNYTDVSYFAFFKTGLVNNEYTFPLDKKLKDLTGQYFVLDSKEQALDIIADGEEHIDMLREAFEIKYNQILNCDTLEQLEEL